VQDESISQGESVRQVCVCKVKASDKCVCAR